MRAPRQLPRVPPRQPDEPRTTESGLSIIVDGFNGLNVGGVNVMQPHVMARTGVIHIVDAIIQPLGAAPAAEASRNRSREA